ncbi:Mitochondrial substrate carrier family protein L [Smittium mucronatum]|uniref:Mitochondrial substrate carrier family protein L n=1 Tax=Smittium mucronatum TaxID=133383 RepID=A0A1R0GSP2_9FUNG|nr:Mitochondrial substrate carrier family protein L [Smittium mucronatum]
MNSDNRKPPPASIAQSNVRYRDRFAGFAAGIASGATKLVEKFRGLYKGATPPLIGWTIMDAIQLGTLSNVRLILQGGDKNKVLTSFQHGCAGVVAGWAVSLVATPVELLKMRLQTQYNAYGSIEKKTYNSALDCARKIVQKNGIQGLWFGLHATLIQRSFFFILWGSYDVYSKYLRSLYRIPEFPYIKKMSINDSELSMHKESWLSNKAVSFLAGGLSANTFWTLVFPFDVIKNRYMADTTGKYPSLRATFDYIYKTEGIKGFFRGFVPSFIRAFPTNACAVFVWDTTMRFMTGHGHN